MTQQLLSTEETYAFDPGSQLKWLTRPMLVVFVILLPLIPFIVRREYLIGSLLAYLNCVIIAWFTFYLLKNDMLLGLLVALAMPFLMFGFSGSSLYFAIMRVEPTYNTLMGYDIPHLEGMARVQLVVLAFLATYCPTVLFFFNRLKGEDGPPLAAPRLFTYIVLGFCMALLVGFVAYMRSGAERAAPSSFDLGWWAYGLVRYDIGLFLTVGAFSTFLPSVVIIALIVLAVPYMLIFAASSMRFYGLLPIFFFFVGYFFMSAVSQKKKTIVLLVLVVGFMFYMLMGQATKELSWGGLQDLSFRIRLMFDPASYRDLPDAGVQTMARLFMTGGHSIITRTPEEVPYFGVNPVSYIWEMIRTLAPGFLYNRPVYEGSHHLLRYDLNVVFSAIEISHIGHYWMLGGWLPVLLGGVVTGSMFGFMMWLTARARRVSWAKALIYLSVFGMVTFQSFRYSLLYLWGRMIWYWAMAAIVWLAIKFLLPTPSYYSDEQLSEAYLQEQYQTA